MEALSQPMTEDPSQHRQERSERLDILRRKERFCDVTIAVKDKEFKAHKVVLAAASPFFLTLLESDMRESKEQLIRIELEEATPSVMEDVLQYIYTGNVSVTDESAHNLIATAEYLLLPSLKTVVGRCLKETVTIENCIFNYYFAEKYQCGELKEKLSEVVKSNFSAVMETSDFLSLDMKQVMEWVSSDEITVNAEEEVFKGIVKWANQNKSERERYFPDLLHQLRLMSISHDFLLNELVKEELVTKNTEFCLNFVLNAMKLVVSATDGQVVQRPRKCLDTHTDAIFVCGGRKSLCYLPKQNVWYMLADTLSDHRNHTITQCGDKIYIVGGQSVKLGESHVMEYYIPATNSWGAIQRAIVESRFNCCAVLKGIVYAIYWCDEYYQSIHFEICRYDPEKNYWDKVNAPPTKRGDPCVVTDEQHLYIIGGISRGNDMSTVEKFDPSNKKWEEVAATNEKRRGAFGVAMNGKVYIAGGRQGCKVIGTCEVYNPITNEWHLMPSLVVPRRDASMVCIEGRLYVLSGSMIHDSRWARVLSVEMFDSERNEWKEKSVIPVESFETAEEQKKMNSLKACFARLFKGVIDKLESLLN